MVSVRCFQIQKEKCNFQRENVFWDHFTITCHFQTFSRKKYGYEHAQFYNVVYTLKWMDTRKSIIPYVVYAALEDMYQQQCICNLDSCISQVFSNLIIPWIVNLCIDTIFENAPKRRCIVPISFKTQKGLDIEPSAAFCCCYGCYGYASCMLLRLLAFLLS